MTDKELFEGLYFIALLCAESEKNSEDHKAYENALCHGTERVKRLGLSENYERWLMHKTINIMKEIWDD